MLGDIVYIKRYAVGCPRYLRHWVGRFKNPLMRRLSTSHDSLHRILHSIFASRLILNIRKAAKQRLVTRASKGETTGLVLPFDVMDERGADATELSELEFAESLSSRPLGKGRPEESVELDVLGGRTMNGNDELERSKQIT